MTCSMSLPRQPASGFGRCPREVVCVSESFPVLRRHKQFHRRLRKHRNLLSRVFRQTTESEMTGVPTNSWVGGFKALPASPDRHNGQSAAGECTQNGHVNRFES